MNKNILVLEDEQSNINSLYKLLQLYMQDYNFQIYSSGEDVFKDFKKGSFSLAIIDLLLKNSRIQGIDVIKKIREIDSEIKIVIVTGTEYQAAPIDSQYKELNILDWLKKPIKASELEEYIRKLEAS